MSAPRRVLLPVDVPTHWSTSQANALLDFLEALQQVIWDTYEDAIVEEIVRDLDQPDVPPSAEKVPDDLPW
jgi:hypothetical protein